LPPNALNPPGHCFITQPIVGNLRGGHHHVELHAMMAPAPLRSRRGAAEGEGTFSRLLNEIRNRPQKLDLSRRLSSVSDGADNACEV
jgi:hypothetical protein